MTRYQWEESESFNSFGYHLDPDKEEQLKWIKIETENQVKRALKLTKSLNYNNKDRNLRSKSEAIHLIEDFPRQYDSLYSLYEDLREKVKINLSGEAYAKMTSSNEVKKFTNFDLQAKKTPEYSEIIKVVSIQGEDELETMNQNLDTIKDLEEQVASLKVEISTISKEKTQLKDQVKRKSGEAKQMKEKISKLEARILKLDATCKDNEIHRKQFEDNEKQNLCRISDLLSKTNVMQIELNNLKQQKRELEGNFSCETKKWSSELKSVKEQLSSLQNEFVSVNSQKTELESEIKKKSKERSDCLLRIEVLRNELTLNVKNTLDEKAGLKLQIRDLEQQIHSLSSKKNELGEELKKISNEAFQINAEKENLKEKILELQSSLDEKENELLNEKTKFKAYDYTLSLQNKSLEEEVRNLKEKMVNLQMELEKEKLESSKSKSQMDIKNTELVNLQTQRELLQIQLKALQTELEKQKQDFSLSRSEMDEKNIELTNKVVQQEKTLFELEAVIKKLKDENQQAQTELSNSKANLNLVEKQFEEMAKEFRKEFDDKYKIMSRRIKVAEQLQAETQEWFIKAKETYIQENKDLKAKAGKAEIGFKNVNDMTLIANDVLSSLDSVSLKFEECTDHFLNRMSKSSCELKFAKHWAMRKNRVLIQVKEELDHLLQQLEDKEKESLVFREKVWKSENKIRELEKMLKEKEDAMLGFNEEKREAIRQLCVLIDYQRGRSDLYKKRMSDMYARRRKA